MPKSRPGEEGSPPAGKIAVKAPRDMLPRKVFGSSPITGNYASSRWPGVRLLRLSRKLETLTGWAPRAFRRWQTVRRCTRLRRPAVFLNLMLAVGLFSVRERSAARGRAFRGRQRGACAPAFLVEGSASCIDKESAANRVEVGRIWPTNIQKREQT